MRVVIFGAAGFIGTNLSRALLKNNEFVDVTELVLIDENKDYFKKSPVLEDSRVTIVIRSYLKESLFGDLIKEGDLVFHLVSTTNPTSSNQHISDEITKNIAISVNILEACVENRAAKVIFISSGGTVYGNAKCPISESSSTNPITTYGIQKLAIEKLLYLYNYLHGLDYRIVRLSNPYGPYQRPNGRLGAITTFTDRAMRGKEVIVYGDGSVVRDYIYIDDAIRAVLTLASNECKYRIYNVGSGRGISINDVLDEIQKALNLKMKVEYTPSRSVDLKENFLDISRYEGEFERIEYTKLYDGIQQTFLFLKRHTI